MKNLSGKSRRKNEKSGTNIRTKVENQTDSKKEKI
jgi:hypothetical protein